MKLYLIVRQIAALALQALAAAVVPDRVPLPAAHPVVHLALQPVPETEEEKEVVVKASMPRGDTRIRRKKGIKKGKEKGIETRRETVIKKERKETMLFPIRLNKRDDPGIVFVINVALIFPRLQLIKLLIIILLISQVALST